jgi:NADH dehydrogenase FAD-containing subunit
VQPGGATERDQQELAYDYLIYALGSRTDRESVPGVATFAYGLDASGAMGAPELRERLLTMADTGGRVVVVGAGPTGIEIASEIADTFPKFQVTMVTRGTFGAFQDAPVQAYMRKALHRLGVEIRE